MRLAATFWGTAQGSYTRHLSRTIESNSLPPAAPETSEAAAQVHSGAGSGTGGAADKGIGRALRDHLGRLLPRLFEEAQCPLQEGCKVAGGHPSGGGPLERPHPQERGPRSFALRRAGAGSGRATLATVVQGGELQYFCRVRDLDGCRVRVRDLGGVMARHLDVCLREGLPEAFQKRLLGLAGPASTPWGRAIRSSPQLKGVLSQDWARYSSPRTTTWKDVHRVFLNIRESANARSPPPPDVGDLLRDPELPASLRDWIVSSC
ncbi:hypothetical protein CYMTET_13182 [Cymbomonas tetramitiformis]|uniref:Uncharacterized protein n=1 Tax=Cymbomonas tetramitiformis TaxID=36881 RepID=A0AAE0LBG0_9CHLO|nr:hypothetical protein CYMTET_13182 [Cymbomonas tetramitiformis]